jgi:hypothetical protein
VIVALGWQGAANHCDDPHLLASILRSWEDRFDACVVGVGYDTLELWVGRPPRSSPEALAVAAEHLAFCPDNVLQGPGTIRRYSASIRGSERW